MCRLCSKPLQTTDSNKAPDSNGIHNGGASLWLGGLRPPNKNTIDPSRGVIRGNRGNVLPETRKICKKWATDQGSASSKPR